jgi:hypothetical protein
MKILLSPNTTPNTDLRDAYNGALRDAEELYIASAYLTDWDVKYKLGPACKHLTFLVGTDFGLTRKRAMLNVLRWIPQKISSEFGAVPQGSGFHPKVMAWKSRSRKYYCIIGSSNLSKAAFSSNCEANVLLEIDSDEFARLCEWLAAVPSSPVSKDWIKHHYTEATAVRTGRVTGLFAIRPSDLPHGLACVRAVLERRRKQATFSEIAGKLKAAARHCSEKEISRTQFWKFFWGLWAKGTWRFQGKGIERKGKTAKWEEVCGALVKILDQGQSAPISRKVDRVVSEEIDRLAKIRNPMRGAWLSEMLCHYFPESYPINDAPVKAWLTAIKLPGRRGATEGQRYTQLAQTLRLAVREHHPAGARNLAELDGAVWQWAHDRGLLKDEFEPTA